MDAFTTFGPLEAVGQYVRTPRLPDGSGGFMVADCGVTSPKNQEYARLFAGAPELLEALQTMLADAVVLSDETLEVFRDYSDDEEIHGWEKARWLRAAAAAKKARAAIANATGSAA